MTRLVSEGTGWKPTASYARSVLGGLLLAIGAVALGRPDLLVIAVPLLGAALWAALQRPSQPVYTEFSVEHQMVRENDVTRLTVSVAAEASHVETITACFRSPVSVPMRPWSGRQMVSVEKAQAGELAVQVRPWHWGSHKIEPPLVDHVFLMYTI